MGCKVHNLLYFYSEQKRYVDFHGEVWAQTKYALQYQIKK